MANISPFQLINMLRGGNPQQIAEQLISQNFPNDPLMAQLLQMGKSGNQKGIEDFAKQFLNQKGLDYNTELSNLMSLIK